MSFRLFAPFCRMTFDQVRQRKIAPARIASSCNESYDFFFELIHPCQKAMWCDFPAIYMLSTFLSKCCLHNRFCYNKIPSINFIGF